jgi:hypothetical protein
MPDELDDADVFPLEVFSPIRWAILIWRLVRLELPLLLLLLLPDADVST